MMDQGEGTKAMTFQGTVLSVRELLQRAHQAPVSTSTAAGVGLRHDAANNAARYAVLIASGASLQDGWRFGILQTLDDYNSTLRRGGVELARQVFTSPPPPTGSGEIDAAFAALGDYVASRDGWDAPQWVRDPSRRVKEWFASVPRIFHDVAKAESPPEFRSRGIFITSDSLARA